MTGSDGAADVPVDPGLCGVCRHVSVNRTRRGTVYFRCTAAITHPELPKYPDLPVLECPVHEPVAGSDHTAAVREPRR